MLSLDIAAALQAVPVATEEHDAAARQTREAGTATPSRPTEAEAEGPCPGP